MCGICGIAGRSTLGPDAATTVAAMTRALAHRGPDAETHYTTPQVQLGFRRLSIIDVAGGAQPLYNEDRTLALVFNGEIYNYKELQAELRARGHQLRTGSDAEVLLHLYEERQAGALHALRGMFAFALHDTRRRRLLLARDRMGEKPLYLHVAPERVTFASELGAILGAGVVPLELDPVSVDRFFHYLYVPEPASMVRGVRQLDAGSLMEIDLDTWQVEERRWWNLLDAPAVTGNPASLVREELDRVASLVIRSDVPVGVALSGGLDSSTVAALAARAHGPGLAAFTVGYRGRPATDERAQAAELARDLGIPLHEAELDEADMVAEFPATVREHDEPMADISGFGHRAVMRLAREHRVPVLLTGYGGDELFWGYDWVRDAVTQTARKQLSAARGFPAGDYLKLGMPRRIGRRALLDWARDLAGVRTSLATRARDRDGGHRPVFYDLLEEYGAAQARRGSVFTPAFLAATESQPAHLPFGEMGSSATLTIMDRIFATYLRSIGLAQGDRLAMAHSVEARVPLVDYRLVELVVGLQKGRPELPSTPKAWLRDAMRDTLPAAVLDRPKQGFAPPVFAWHRALIARYGGWLRDGELVARGVLTAKGAANLASQSIPRHGYSALPFAALVLEVWCREMRRAA
jgi:asparagine synthase (glutamine-hydrolysing)